MRRHYASRSIFEREAIMGTQGADQAPAATRTSCQP